MFNKSMVSSPGVDIAGKTLLRAYGTVISDGVFESCQFSGSAGSQLTRPYRQSCGSIDKSVRWNEKACYSCSYPVLPKIPRLRSSRKEGLCEMFFKFLIPKDFVLTRLLYRNTFLGIRPPHIVRNIQKPWIQCFRGHCLTPQRRRFASMSTAWRIRHLGTKRSAPSSSKRGANHLCLLASVFCVVRGQVF